MIQVLALQKEIAFFGYVLSYPGKTAIKMPMYQYNTLHDTTVKFGYNFRCYENIGGYLDRCIPNSIQIIIIL